MSSPFLPPVTPKVSLVGAGPGDIDLITLKGIKALKQANVVLYDALVNPELLEWAPKNALKVYVGKRASNHRYSQDEINQMLIDYAKSHGHVVRLKGGDPFVFGRGYEELEFASAFGIAVDVVPGISSSVGLPAMQGVPLTLRGTNESFWVLTATTKHGGFSKDLPLAVQSTATVIILMGMKKLPKIVELFQQEGKGETPVMIVQEGSTPREKVGLGTINSIEGVVAEKGLGAPAVIVVGGVVNKHPEIRDAYLSEVLASASLSSADPS